MWSISISASAGLAIVVSPLLTLTALAKPADLTGAQIQFLEDFFQRPVGERVLSQAEISQFAQTALSDHADQQLVAVLVLAFANDEQSGMLLKRLAMSEHNELLAGAAHYSLEHRKVLGRAKADIRNQLLKSLKNSKNTYTRMFLANRLAVDFPLDSAGAILTVAKSEKDDLVQTDMLYYIVQLADENQVREALEIRWNERYHYAESLAFIMGAITPGRPKGDIKNSSSSLLRELRKKSANGARGTPKAVDDSKK